MVIIVTIAQANVILRRISVIGKQEREGQAKERAKTQITKNLDAHYMLIFQSPSFSLQNTINVFRDHFMLTHRYRSYRHLLVTIILLIYSINIIIIIFYDYY